MLILYNSAIEHLKSTVIRNIVPTQMKKNGIWHFVVLIYNKNTVPRKNMASIHICILQKKKKNPSTFVILEFKVNKHDYIIKK